MASSPLLVSYIDQLLDTKSFSDYCVNGLQVPTSRAVHKIVSGVTASLDLIERAVSRQADMILVHHGLFWATDPRIIDPMTKQRLLPLLTQDIGLLAYHLPLDAHPELGNNACLGRLMGCDISSQTFGKSNLGFLGTLPEPVSGHVFALKLENILARKPLMIEPQQAGKSIRKVAWVTGGGQSYFRDAVNQGVDAFVTGEASEFVYHMAKELNVFFFAAGHHATERYGVQALGEHLAKKFDLVHEYLDLDNPV